VLELVEQYWEAVGIRTSLNIIERSFMTERYLNNQHEVGRYFGGPGLIDWMLDSRHEIPTHWESIFAVPWANYYSGAEGPVEEPPADVQEMQRIWTEMQLEPDLETQFEIIEPALEIAADRFDVIGILLTPPSYGIVRNDFHNVPERMFNTGGAYNDPGPARPEQFWTSRDLD
jgi:peptide/nickel transport system substrate-binding protein